MGVGTRKDGHCIYLYGTKQILCASALRHYVTIKQRNINTPKLGSLEPIETFTTVANVYAAIVARDFTSRFNGVNTRDGTITHMFYMRYDDTLYWLDRNSIWLEYKTYGNSKTRRFKMLSAKILDEDGAWMAFYASERGDSSLGATQC